MIAINTVSQLPIGLVPRFRNHATIHRSSQVITGHRPRVIRGSLMILGFRRIYFPWSLLEDVGQDRLGRIDHDRTLCSRALEMMVNN